MTCSDVSNRIGETRTIENTTIKFKSFLGSEPNLYASIDITYPWNTTHSTSLLYGETKTVVNPSNTSEYITVKFKSYIVNVLAIFTICHEAEATTGSIFCESTPNGAKVFYKDNYGDSYIYMGTTTMWIEEVPAGIRYIKMTLEGYEDHEDSYVVNAGEITGVNINLTPTTATLSCNTTPTEANIYLNGVYQGHTNKVISDLEPGSYIVKYTKKGYQDYSVTITINAGVTSYVTTILVPLSTVGNIYCAAFDIDTGETLNATLQLDGMTIVPKSPYTMTDIEPGSHTITYILEGYETLDRTVTVTTGNTVTATAFMVKTSNLQIDSITVELSPDDDVTFEGITYYGVAIYITVSGVGTDDLKIGTGCPPIDPLVISATAGQYEATKGYIPGTYDIGAQIGDSQKCTSIIVKESSITGIFSCASDPSGAEIWIDNAVDGIFENKGLTGTQANPTIVENIHLGITKVEFRKDGFDTCEGSYFVEAGQTYEIYCKFSETPIYKNTSIIIGITPSEIGVGQYSTISGGLHIEGTGSILPGLPIKLYVDKGQGFTHIATPNTPANGTGQFEYYYETIQEDVGKTLQFKWLYEGSESLLLASSESATRNLIVQQEVILIETILTLSSSPSTDVQPTTLVELTAYLTQTDNKPLPDGSFVKFYKGNTLLVTSETKNGYAFYDYPSVIEDSEQTVNFTAKYLGIENKYDISESTINVSFKKYIPIKECVEHLTQLECEANNCYWWTDGTCQSAPEGTTEYFDVYIKPYSFYDGKYETAVAGALALLAKLTGAVANYMSSVTGYEYKGLDILEEASKQVIVVRVYLKDTSVTTLVAPIVIGAIAGIIAGILLLAIGYVVGTSESDYSKKEVIELINSASDKAIEECKDRYPNRLTLVDEAANFKHCVGGIETVRIIGSADVVEEDSSEHIDYVINPVIVELDNQLDDGTLLPENIDVAINDNLTVPTKEVVDDYKQQAVDEDCAWMIADTCIITKKALKTLTWGAIGIGGLFVVSTVKDIAKK